MVAHARRVRANHVAADALRRVERRVGAVDERAEIARVVGVDRDTDRDRDVARADTGVRERRRGDGRAQLLGRGEGGAPVGTREHHRELLAPVARDEVHPPRRGAEHRRHPAQHRIARRVPERVVVAAEVIDVDEGDRRRVLEAHAPLELVLEPREQAPAVVRARERVRLRQPHHLLVQPSVRDGHGGLRRDRLEQSLLAHRERTGAGPERDGPRGLLAARHRDLDPARTRLARREPRPDRVLRAIHRADDPLAGGLVHEQDLQLRRAEGAPNLRRHRAEQLVEIERGAEGAPELEQERELPYARLELRLERELALHRRDRGRVLDPEDVEVRDRGERLVVGAGHLTDLVVAVDGDAVKEVSLASASHARGEPDEAPVHEEAHGDEVRPRERGGEDDEGEEPGAVERLGGRGEQPGLVAQPEHAGD